jgi:hypothetical protein
MTFELIKIISDIKEKVLGCVDGRTGDGQLAVYSHISQLLSHELKLHCVYSI